jgi:hypothetical protein
MLNMWFFQADKEVRSSNGEADRTGVVKMAVSI